MAALWKPAAAFGGDCYDMLRFSNTRLGLSIADVAGKGLPAALLMANLQASVRAFGADDARPETVTRQVNRALCRHTPLDRFVTFFYAAIDTVDTALSPAAMPGTIRRSSSTPTARSRVRPREGMVLGVLEDNTYSQAEVRLDPGDRLVLFTDGITEAGSHEGREFGDDRLVESRRSRIGTSRRPNILDAIFPGRQCLHSAGVQRTMPRSSRSRVGQMSRPEMASAAEHPRPTSEHGRRSRLGNRASTSAKQNTYARRGAGIRFDLPLNR